jgi:hypothetical protein
MRVRAVMTLVLVTMLTGSAGAQDPRAAEVGGPSAAEIKRSAASTSRLAADSTREAADADLRKRASAAPQDRARPARKLTVQQKRIFVLGLGATEKK